MPTPPPDPDAAPGPVEPQTDATTLAEVPAQPAPAQEPPPASPAPAWGNWRYTGPPGRAYTNVPVTVETGDIVTWPAPPGTDGCWQPTSEPPTRLPDNHRPEPTDTTEEG